MPLGPEWVKGGGVLGDRVQPVYPRLRKDRHLPKLSRRCQSLTILFTIRWWRAVDMTIRADVIVLGAGMVGVSVALHLRQRGRDVVLVDRRGAGEETSYGNSGLIQREGVIPTRFHVNSAPSCATR